MPQHDDNVVRRLKEAGFIIVGTTTLPEWGILPVTETARFGITPRYRHIANSAATLTRPDAHFDLVRPGIAVYGLSPVAAED